MNKQPQITDATREAFVDAFFKLAKIKSIYQITIREITNLAGYNRTTFYRYFEDVFALLEYAEDEFLQYTRKALDEKLDKPFDESLEEPMEKRPIGERHFFEILIRCFHENKDRVFILMSEQNRSHFLRRIKENVTTNLDRLGIDSPKKRVVRDIYFYGIFHAISTNLQSRDSLSDEDLLDMIQKLFENWYWPEMEEKN